MALTKAQQEAVNTLDIPLFIQAGAGTGKTHTLTHRLVHAFSPESDKNQSGAVVQNADEFVTITFTNKAAGELLGRIRSALRNEGLDEAALEVDSAWISTIHSMCKRILVEHALDTGIDASAELIDESQQDYYLKLAYDRFHEQHTDDARLQELLTDYGAQTLYEHIRGLINAVILEQEGFSHIELGPRVLKTANDASSLLEALCEQLDRVQALAEELIRGGNKNKGPLNLVEFCTTTRAYAGELIKRGASGEGAGREGDRGQLSTCEEGNTNGKSHAVDLRTVYDFACELKPANASGDDLAEAIDLMRDAVATLRINSMAAKHRFDMESLLGYAREVTNDYTSFKQRHALMDTDELLARAFALLNNNAAIAREYQDQFKLVMVDEFQDTDRLQVGIIENLVPADLSTLATVGDRQQAIYGFRGADVTVFNEQQKKMEAKGGKSISLDSNFRSHDEILRFVDKLFGQQKVFGEELLALKHGRKEDKPFLSGNSPRVEILMAAGASNEKKQTGLALLRKDKARMVAQEFARLRDEEQCKPGDMVILLRNMINVTLYRDALREQGFESRVTGGSAFFETQEVHVLTNYLKALANPYDNPAVLAALMSPLYNLSDAELLATAGTTNPYTGLKTSRDPLVHTAALQFEEALRQSQQTSTAQLLRDEIVRSGWSRALAEQGAEGMMVLANIYKFIALVDEHEQTEGRSIVKAAAYFSDLLRIIDEGTKVTSSLGTLQEFDTDAVQIMTVHASKGLEYPIVAVAEFEEGVHREAARFMVQGTDGLYPSIKVEPACKVDKKTVWGQYFRNKVDTLTAAISTPDEAKTAGALYWYIRKNAQEQEEAEAKRVLYVACTRAREVLMLVTCDKSLAQTEYDALEPRTGLLGDIESAFFAKEGLPRGTEPFETSFEFGSQGASYQGRYRYNVHDSAADDENDRGEAQAGEQGEGVLNLLPRVGDGPSTVPLVDVPMRADTLIATEVIERAPQLYSYSSLAELGGGEQESEAYHDEAQSVSQSAHSDAWYDTQADTQTTTQPGAPLDIQIDAQTFGSAFHLAAQRWIEEECKTDSISHLTAIAARTYGLDAQSEERLEQAFIRWITSERAAQIACFPLVFAEYPFVVPVEGSVPLQGAIDVLGVDRENKKALIIDYKTGTSAQGEPDVLYERYKLQASCYAYAVLKSFSPAELNQVELIFIRPEVEADNTLQETPYHITRQDLPALLERIQLLATTEQ